MDGFEHFNGGFSVVEDAHAKYQVKTLIHPGQLIMGNGQAEYICPAQKFLDGQILVIKITLGF
jgi:hypothetical protein